MNKSNDIYIDLVSNSNQLHENDNNADFTTILKNPPQLEDGKQYLVGLTALNLPNTFDLINPDSCYFEITSIDVGNKPVSIAVTSK